jgi:hypothetical protein
LFSNDHKETYKANEETVLSRGRCLIVLFVKIIKAFPVREGFLVCMNYDLERVWD